MKKIDSLVTMLMVACALLTTGAVVQRVLLPTPKAVSGGVQRSTYIEDWRSDQEVGIRIGAPSAPVQLLEFSDFECPYCATFRNALRVIEDRYPRQIALTFLHFPIPGHRFALPAARVAECANDQGKFEAMHDALFERQEQFGLKPWDDYATSAGVPDMAAFDACIKKTDPIPRVEEGKALGVKRDVRGTPTIIINGWKLGHPPTEQELDGMVKKVLAGKSPVDGKS